MLGIIIKEIVWLPWRHKRAQGTSMARCRDLTLFSSLLTIFENDSLRGPDHEGRTRHTQGRGLRELLSTGRRRGLGGRGGLGFWKSQRSKSKCLPNTKASVKEPKMGHASVNLKVSSCYSSFTLVWMLVFLNGIWFVSKVIPKLFPPAGPKML